MMNRTDLINYLIHQRSAKSYLEISAHDKQSNFNRIQCTRKTTTFPRLSDEFFSHNEVQADVIFIDGVHTEEQAIRDICYAKRSLSQDGIIILHDCMPPDKWHQRGIEEVRIGENWNGAVWKAVLREFNTTPAKCTLLDTDWGCGIIDTSITQIPKCRELPPDMDYDLHYPWLLEYKSNVAAYLRERVKVFYHLACMGNWREVFEEQVQQLKDNGFQQVYLTVLGTEKDLDFVNVTCERRGLVSYIIFKAGELTYFEKPALMAVEEYAKQHEGYVLYIHSKGVSNPADVSKIKWRRLMMQQLIQNWESCITQLPYYDAIGVNWRDMPPTSHFCGNFWYASTNYLRKLADFSKYFDNPRFQIHDRIDNKRLGCEFWISSGSRPPRVLSLYCRNVDFCNQNFWRNK
ncbi:MAG: class I SAM-dependent methyltransferase [Ginsengibacter sp.]